MLFYLGVHHAHWLAQISFPLFLSRRTLAKRRSLPRAVGPWALDSGGFSELALHGMWKVSAAEYAREVRRYSGEVGGLQWAAAMDWACDPALLRKTGLSITAHQQRTIASYLDLLNHEPSFPWVPVIQGWNHEDYFRHVEEYERSGINLRQLPRVGLGSVHSRQNIAGIEILVRRLAALGLRLHAFGLNTPALLRAEEILVSSDSMAWSAVARKQKIVLLGHESRHQCCNNCLDYALLWRDQLIRQMGERGNGARQHMQLPHRDNRGCCPENGGCW